MTSKASRARVINKRLTVMVDICADCMLVSYADQIDD